MNQKHLVAGIAIIGLALGMGAIYFFFSTNGTKDAQGQKTPPWSLLLRVPNPSPLPDTESCKDDESLQSCSSDSDCLVVEDFHADCACPTAVNRNRLGCWNSLREEQAKLLKDRIEKGEIPEIIIECQPCPSLDTLKAICENGRCKAVGPGYPDAMGGDPVDPNVLEP
jgi:hypothetical protein